MLICEFLTLNKHCLCKEKLTLNASKVEFYRENIISLFRFKKRQAIVLWRFQQCSLVS